MIPPVIIIRRAAVRLGGGANAAPASRDVGDAAGSAAVVTEADGVATVRRDGDNDGVVVVVVDVGWNVDAEVGIETDAAAAPPSLDPGWGSARPSFWFEDEPDDADGISCDVAGSGPVVFPSTGTPFSRAFIRLCATVDPGRAETVCTVGDDGSLCVPSPSACAARCCSVSAAARSRAAGTAGAAPFETRAGSSDGCAATASASSLAAGASSVNPRAGPMAATAGSFGVRNGSVEARLIRLT